MVDKSIKHGSLGVIVVMSTRGTGSSGEIDCCVVDSLFLIRDPETVTGARRGRIDVQQSVGGWDGVALWLQSSFDWGVG